MASMKIRAQVKGEFTTVKSLITHIMETGLRKDKKSGKLVPAHHITEIFAELNGKEVMRASWGPAISKDPYFAFKIKGAKAGDKLKLAWIDNLGNSDSIETQVKQK